MDFKGLNLHNIRYVTMGNMILLKHTLYDIRLCIYFSYSSGGPSLVSADLFVVDPHTYLLQYTHHTIPTYPHYSIRVYTHNIKPTNTYTCTCECGIGVCSSDARARLQVQHEFAIKISEHIFTCSHINKTGSRARDKRIRHTQRHTL